MILTLTDNRDEGQRKTYHYDHLAEQWFRKVTHLGHGGIIPTDHLSINLSLPWFHPFTHPPIYPPTYPPTYLSLPSSPASSLHPSLQISIHPSIYPIIHPSTLPSSIHLPSHHLSLPPSIHPSIHLSISSKHPAWARHTVPIIIKAKQLGLLPLPYITLSEVLLTSFPFFALPLMFMVINHPGLKSFGGQKALDHLIFLPPHP